MTWDGYLIGGELPSAQHQEDTEAKKVLAQILSYQRRCIEQGIPTESVGLTPDQLVALQRFLSQFPNESSLVAGVPIHMIPATEDSV